MILVTGGTGTVGREMLPVLEWLMPGETIHLLRRPAADIRLPGLGLSSEERAALQRQARVIIHCAAEIRFNLPLDEVRETNLEGTRRMLEFAEGCPRLERFAHVSTLYLPGGGRAGSARSPCRPARATLIPTRNRSMRQSRWCWPQRSFRFRSTG